MLTTMTEADWTIVLQVFAASRSRRGDKGRNDRKFLEALHYFVVHNITWRALPEKFGHWNSVVRRSLGPGRDRVNGLREELPRDRTRWRGKHSSIREVNRTL